MSISFNKIFKNKINKNNIMEINIDDSCCLPSCKNKCFTDDFCKTHSEKYKFKKPSECAVCFHSLENEKHPILECGHWIHYDCIFKSNKLECPLCRTSIKIPRKIKKIYIENIKQKKIIEKQNRLLEQQRLSKVLYNKFENYYNSIQQMFNSSLNLENLDLSQVNNIHETLETNETELLNYVCSPYRKNLFVNITSYYDLHKDSDSFYYMKQLSFNFDILASMFDCSYFTRNNIINQILNSEFTSFSFAKKKSIIQSTLN